jgi:hypothetical protein
MPDTAPEIVFVTIPQETVNDESVRILAWKVASGIEGREGPAALRDRNQQSSDGH